MRNHSGAKVDDHFEVPVKVPVAQLEQPRPREETTGDSPVRPGILAVLMIALASCSGSPPPPPSDPTASAAIIKKDCSDPKWQEENLGLWYSVCRQPLRW